MNSRIMWAMCALLAVVVLGGVRLLFVRLWPYWVVEYGLEPIFADMPGVELPGAKLPGASLAGAYLCYADLTSADLTGANLAGADLSCASMSGANSTESTYPVRIWPPIGSMDLCGSWTWTGRTYQGRS